MSNLTSVGITAGVPTSGTGTVSTIDNLLAAGAPISDGTTNLVAVKAASTAPVATDKALVVSLSPNSVNANGQATMANSAPVTVASNQSAIPVTLTSTTLTGTSAVNTAQVNGVTTLTGTGATGTGAQRVTVATDTATIAGSTPGTAGTASTNVLTVQGVASMTKLLVTPDSVALPANQSVNLAQVAGATTAVGSGVQATALRTTLATDSPGIVTLGQTTKSASVPVTIASDQALTVTPASSYPSGATAIAATSGNVAAATATATLAGAAAKTTYISGFSVVGSGATVGAIVIVTITNLVGSVTFSYPLAAIAGALLMNTPLLVTFPNPIPASATNTSIVVSCPSLGTGNTNNAVNAFGYQL